jgi:hypothetical protein
MNKQKDFITTEFDKEMRIVENLHQEEMEKVPQEQRKKIETKFEKRSHKNENLHREELDSLKHEKSREVEQVKKNYT